jgi:hypothetical protein
VNIVTSKRNGAYEWKKQVSQPSVLMIFAIAGTQVSLQCRALQSAPAVLCSSRHNHRSLWYLVGSIGCMSAYPERLVVRVLVKDNIIIMICTYK